MMTYANLPQSVAAYLLAHPGERTTITWHQLKCARLMTATQPDAWASKHDLQYEWVEGGVVVWHKPKA